MFSKVFFVLAAVCVVKASVIPDNVFDETEVASDPKACSPQACRDACRRLGFPIGVCSGGRCFCRRAKAQEDVLEKDSLDLEELVSRTENEPETEVVSDPKSCNTQACRNACRRLGFTTGVCSGGRCFCRRSSIQDAYPLIDAAGDEKEEAIEISSNEENDPETDVASDPKSCNTQACRNACRRLGFSTGVCSGGRCFCRRSTVQEDIPEQDALHQEELVSRTENDPETGIASSPKNCYSQACRNACRRLGWLTGDCFNGKCKCRNYPAQEAVSEPLLLGELVSRTENDPESEVASDPKSCNTQACRNACRRLGFTTGVCSGGRCYCRR